MQHLLLRSSMTGSSSTEKHKYIENICNVIKWPCSIESKFRDQFFLPFAVQTFIPYITNIAITVSTFNLYSMQCTMGSWLQATNDLQPKLSKEICYRLEVLRGNRLSCIDTVVVSSAKYVTLVQFNLDSNAYSLRFFILWTFISSIALFWCFTLLQLAIF